MSGGCLSLFGLPFLLAGLALSWLYFSGYSEWWKAQGWHEVPCWIESAELKENRGDDSTTYKAMATYRYEYGGREYHADRVSLGSGSDNVGDFQHRAHRELSRHVVKKSKNAEALGQEGDRIPFRCYVNPEKPEEAVLYRDLRWQMQRFMAIFALTFPAVGAGLVAGGVIGTRQSKRDAGLREMHPGEPWKWKSNWTGRTIAEDAALGGDALFYYTLWSALVIFPLIATTALSGAFRTDGMSWLLLIFVALWCVPAWFTLKRIRQRLAVGATRFEPAEMPAYPGGTLDGAIFLSRPLPLHRNAGLSLVCTKRVTRSAGDGTSTTSEKIWSHEENVPMDRITREINGFRVPVRFTLPADAPESGSGDDTTTRHLWKLQLKVPGTAIGPTFEIPVFRTEKSAALAETSAAAGMSIHDTATADLPGALAESRIRAEFDGDGFPVSIICPAARNRSMIAFLIIFNLIWTAVSFVLIHQKAPLIFLIIWPLSAAGIWWLIIYQLIHSRTATFSAMGLELSNKLGPWTRTRRFEKSQITGFSHDTNMSSSNTSCYRIRMEDVFGKKQTVVDGIIGPNTAAALAGRLADWRKSGR